MPVGWTTYSVQRGDTLVSIAQKAGTTIESLQSTNCIANINKLRVGQTLFVPIPAGVTAEGSSGYKAEGCTDTNTVIINPKAGQLVKGVLKLEGTATVEGFAFYTIEIRPDSSKTYTLYNSYIKAVVNGALGDLDSSIFPPGIYWIKLTTITQNSQSSASCAIPVLFAPK